MNRPLSLLCSRVKSPRSASLLWDPFVANREDQFGSLDLHLLETLYAYPVNRGQELGAILILIQRARHGQWPSASFLPASFQIIFDDQGANLFHERFVMDRMKGLVEV